MRKKIKGPFLVLIFSIIISQTFAGQTMVQAKNLTTDDDLGFDDDFEEGFEEDSEDEFEEVDADDTGDVDDDFEDNDLEEEKTSEGSEETETPEGSEEIEVPEVTPVVTSGEKEVQKDIWRALKALNVIGINIRKNTEHIKTQFKSTEVAKTTIVDNKVEETKREQNEIKQENIVLAKIGGKYIYYNDVEIIYQQFLGMMEETEEFIYTRQRIFEDIMDEFIIIANSKKYGVYIRENEYEELIKEYKDAEPDSYSEGVEIYGEESFISSIKEQMLYELVCDKILEEEWGENLSNILGQFKVEYIQDTEELVLEDAKFIELYEEELNAFAIESWLKKNRNSVTVEIYEENIKCLEG